tara:strand:- start:66 stop:230 length:165 start_codon:yes stop_codon:yes gene_type:complete
LVVSAKEKKKSKKIRNSAILNQNSLEIISPEAEAERVLQPNDIATSQQSPSSQQ